MIFKKNLMVAAFCYMAMITFSCMQNQKSKVPGLSNVNSGFKAIFFDINDTSVKLDNADSVLRFDKRFESINLSGEEAFWSGHDHFFMSAMGVLKFSDSTKYTLRLAANGITKFRLNNIEIFNYPNLIDTIATTTVNNNPGDNIFEIEYFDGGVTPKIVLEWSKDGGPFIIVPKEAFSIIVRQHPEIKSDSVHQESMLDLNTLTNDEKKDGWKLLFDGNTTKGWHRYNFPGTIGSKWVAENGNLIFKGRRRFRYTLEGYFIEMGPTNKLKDGGMDIVTDDTFSDFELKLEWKISKGGNSGIFYTVLEDSKYDEAWKSSPEMQVLDDFGHKDGIIYKHRSGDLYDLIACKQVTVRPAGEWNKVRIVKNKGNVQHWLNDVLVVEYSLDSPQWKEMIGKSKFSKLGDFAISKQGRIGLQDHDNEVWFRNLKIKELN